MDKSLNDAGGAVYLKSTLFNGENLNFSYCSANFGAALTLLNCDSKLLNVNNLNNTACYDGGVIYSMFGNLSINSSKFLQNNAKNGAGIFCANLRFLSIENNEFKNNHAFSYAGAIYSFSNNNSYFKDNIYLNNSAEKFEDIYEETNHNLTFYSKDFQLYYNLNTHSYLPKYYNLRDLGYVTNVKNQNNGGNCWAFASIAALESAILKASGDYLDLSEENLKNLASLYSTYGWSMDTNNGGYDDMAIGYFVSWLGPILENNDYYSDSSALSPVLESILHVQNIEFLEKSTFYNLNSIKQAIIDYGAVYAGIYMSAYYDSISNTYVQCYRGSNSCDHAVVLVGWDDNFIIPNAPEKGAWIAKNSWGSNWGDNGYFYISYFDNSCPKLGDEAGAFAFILNDTIKYDKNYQYDIAKTDYFLNTTNTVWYKNIFKSTDNEYLAGVSTYFEKNTNWELTISVNNEIKLTQNGLSKAGYYTIKLNNFIPLSVGDTFEISFKITVDKNAGVPISEIVSLNNYFYHENISFISYDGKNWKDLYELTWQYPEHTYSSQVACIKAFTILNPLNTSLDLNIINRTQDNFTIQIKVLNQYGFNINSGIVLVTINDKTYNCPIDNGVSYFTCNSTSGEITFEFSKIGYMKSIKTFEVKNPLINTNIQLNISSNYNPVNITAYVVDEDLNPVQHGSVTFEIDYEVYVVDVCEGYAILDNVFISQGLTDVYATFTDFSYYNSSFTNKSVFISLIDTELFLNISSNEYNNPVTVKAYVCDVNNVSVSRGKVIFNFLDGIYFVDVVDGVAEVTHTFSDTGFKTFNARFYDGYIYKSAFKYIDVEISKVKVNLTVNNIIDENDAIFGLSIQNSTNEFGIEFIYNNITTYYDSDDGYIIVDLKDLDNGTYDYKIKLLSSIYESDDICGTFNISHIKTQIIAGNDSIYYNGVYKVILKDIFGNILPNQDIYLTVNGKTYKNRTNNNGFAVFHIDVGVGDFTATINYVGDGEFINSKITTKISIKSTIEIINYNYPLNSKFTVIFKDSNGNLLVNSHVTIYLSGISHNLVTDKNGKAYVNVNLFSAMFFTKITNIFTGEVKNTYIQVVKRITENKKVTLYYGASKYYKVRVLNDDGKFVSGLKVSFKVNGKTYYGYTNKNGYASFKINLNPGTYTVISKYKGFEATSNIIVKSTLITKDIKVKKSKPIKFKAKLLDSNGKIIKNKKIKFKFKGKTYKVKTNNKGFATLKITKQYKKGKYTIISEYKNLKIKNKIKIV